MRDICEAVADEELLDRIGHDDADAFGQLYDRHVARVFAHCARQLGTIDNADDATAVVFLEAWKHRGSIRLVAGSALPWLLLTSTNVTRNQRRAAFRYRKALQRISPEQSIPDPAQAVVERVAFASSEHALAVALSTLRDVDRRVVSLCLIGGLTYAEAAQVLDISPGAVRSRLMRSRRALRLALQDDGISSSEECDD